MTFKFKPFFLISGLFLVTFLVVLIPITLYVFINDTDTPKSYYSVFIFEALLPTMFILNSFRDATYLRIDDIEKTLKIKTRFHTRTHIIPLNEVLGFSKSSVTGGIRFGKKYKSILIYTRNRNFEFISFNIFSFDQISDELLARQIEFYGNEPYTANLIGKRKYKYNKMEK